MTAVDLPSLQIGLQDRTPRMAKQQRNSIANRLCKKLKTARVAYIINESAPVQAQTGYAIYTLLQDYGGAACRLIKLLRRARLNCT